MQYPNTQGTTVTREQFEQTGQRGTAGLHPQLIGLEGWRVEVKDADGETYRFIVGRSTGWMPCHLAIKRRDSWGGEAVDTRPFQYVRTLYRPDRYYR